MTSATNERQIKASKEQAAKDRKSEREVMVSLMSTVSGRRWVWLRLSEAQLFTEESSLDAGYLAYRQGQRNAGLRLLNAVTLTTPEMYLRMTQENSGVQLQEQETGHDDDND